MDRLGRMGFLPCDPEKTATESRFFLVGRTGRRNAGVGAYTEPQLNRGGVFFQDLFSGKSLSKGQVKGIKRLRKAVKRWTHFQKPVRPSPSTDPPGETPQFSRLPAWSVVGDGVQHERERLKMWAVDVPCELCGAAAGYECRTPADVVAQRPHRARLVLSVVGPRSAPAVTVIERLLREADARATTSTYTLPEVPR